MGMRFRKSIKIMPGVKLNLNKKSFGVTIGGKGAHYTINSKGRRTTTVGIPGTGLSYTSSTSSNTKSSSNKAGNDLGGLSVAEYEAAMKMAKKKLLPVVIFFGWTGAHYFMMHRYGMGILYLCTAGIGGIGWIVDIIRVACESTKYKN